VIVATKGSATRCKLRSQLSPFFVQFKSESMRSLALLQSLILLGAASFAVDLPRGLVVVVNSGEDSVALVDSLHPEAPAKIATRRHPQDVLVSADGSLAYVAEMGTPALPGNTIAVIDVQARTIIKRLSLGTATLPHLLALSHDGHTLWAACAPQNAIVDLDAHSGTIYKLWDTQQKGSYLLAVTPDEKKLYVTNFDAGTVSVIRRSDASVRILSLGGQPIGIDVSPNGSEVWVSNFQSNTITVIDAATDLIAQTLSAGGDGPARIKFTPNGKHVWVTNSRSNELIVFDVARRRVIRRIQTGKFSKGLLVLPDGRHAFVSAMEDNRVVEVDVPTGRVLQRMSTGKAPEGLAWVGSR
jgi:YVTN family beta-propeller protein